MSFWILMEYGAWALSAVFGLYIVVDWLRTDTPEFDDALAARSTERVTDGERPAIVHAETTAYVIFTSGSTGRKPPSSASGPASCWAGIRSRRSASAAASGGTGP